MLRPVYRDSGLVHDWVFQRGLVESPGLTESRQPGVLLGYGSKPRAGPVGGVRWHCMQFWMLESNRLER